jgi:hypothetical protein
MQRISPVLDIAQRLLGRHVIESSIQVYLLQPAAYEQQFGLQPWFIQPLD